MRKLIASALWALALALTACRSGGGSSPALSSGSDTSAPGGSSLSPSTATLSLVAQVGRQLFFDKTLSGSGKMSCATCHDPGYAYGPPNSLAVQLGGPDLQSPGTRAVPSLRYKETTPAYSDSAVNPDGVSLPSPGGGFMWDGRADTLAVQAAVPLLNPVEMDNASPAAVVAAVQAGPTAAPFRQAFGANVFNDTTTAFNDIGQALQAYQIEEPSFHPYSSKYDLYAQNKIGGTLTAAEMRGAIVFSNAHSGNCAACHYPGAGFNGSSALFTDFMFEAIGVPRNPEIAANADSTYFDMGLCGPERTDHMPRSPGAPDVYCGLFKTPTLRNVATRQAFFHNGVMHSLLQVVHFYNTRDTNPEIWYPTVGGRPLATPSPNFLTYGLVTTQYTGGTVQKFNDLPSAYRGNIDTQVPLDGRPAGSTPPMTEQQVRDLVCFLGTLTDGYQLSASRPTSGPCVN
ncbi:cytochrome-c peroxidase [Cupriavidus sp. CuC1]|uniref:cytochrome-c peroxidase n=1 Tax=Cupriavidus sp. CuC1 TaxID=3373131 RepID=UPI0037D3C1C4